MQCYFLPLSYILPYSLCIYRLITTSRFLISFFYFHFCFLLFFDFCFFFFFFFFQAEDGIRDLTVTGVQTCALPISHRPGDNRVAPADVGRHTSRLARRRGCSGRGALAPTEVKHARVERGREVLGAVGHVRRLAGSRRVLPAAAGQRRPLRVAETVRAAGKPARRVLSRSSRPGIATGVAIVDREPVHRHGCATAGGIVPEAHSDVPFRFTRRRGCHRRRRQWTGGQAASAIGRIAATLTRNERQGSKNRSQSIHAPRLLRCV